MHHTIDTYSEYQWATALHSEKDNSVITQLLKVMDNMGLSVQIETDNVPPIYLVKWNSFLYYIKHITGVLHNPTG